MTPRNGELIIGAIQDFITGAYLLTKKDEFFTRGAINQLACQMLEVDNISMKIDIPPPAIQKVDTIKLYGKFQIIFFKFS